MAGYRFVPNLQIPFPETDDGMDRKLYIRHLGNIYVLVSPEVVGVLSEQRHQSYHYFHNLAGTDDEIQLAGLERRAGFGELFRVSRGVKSLDHTLVSSYVVGMAVSSSGIVGDDYIRLYFPSYLYYSLRYFVDRCHRHRVRMFIIFGTAHTGIAIAQV